MGVLQPGTPKLPELGAASAGGAGLRGPRQSGTAGSCHPAAGTAQPHGEDEPPSVPGAPTVRGRALRSPGERQAGALCPVPQGRTYIPPMETVAHVRSEKAGTVSVALLAGRM